MDLDNLKTIWKEQEPLTGQQPDWSELLQKQSRGPIARMRRNLRIEGWLMILTYIPTIIAYFSMFNGQLSLISITLTCIFLFYWVYYYRKNQILKNMQCVTCEVRSNLQGQLKLLGKYIRFYQWSGTIITVLAILMAYMTMRYSLLGHGVPLATGWWRQPAWNLFYLIPFAVILHHFNKGYVNKLYGRHLRKLQDLVREMDE